MSILFCAFIKEMGQTVKNHTMTIIFNFGQQKFISVATLRNQFSSQVSGPAQMMETFSDKHRSQRFELHWYGEAFLWIYHDRLLSRPRYFKFHTCFDNCISSMDSRFCMLVIPWFELPFQRFHSKQCCCWML